MSDMSLLNVEEVLPTLNSRSTLGRVVVKSPSKIAESLSVRTSDKLRICCGRAYLTAESYFNHKRSSKCDSDPSHAQDPLGDGNSDEDEDDEAEADSSFCPVIDSVSSLSAVPVANVNDIEDIEIIEEEPRLLFDNNSPGPRLVISNALRRNIMKSGDSRQNSRHFPQVKIKTQTSSLPNQSQNSSWGSFDIDGENDESNQWVEVEDTEAYGQSDDVRDAHLDALREYRDGVHTQDAEEHDQKMLRCDYEGCIYYTLTEKTLKFHRLNAHDETATNLCNLCICRYKTKSELTRHQKMFHEQNEKAKHEESVSAQHGEGFSKVVEGGIECFKCNGCGYKNLKSGPMKVHARSAHNPFGNHPCPHCSCRYSMQNHLTQHIKILHSQKKKSVPSSGGKTSTVPSSRTCVSNQIPHSTAKTKKPSATSTALHQGNLQSVQFNTNTGQVVKFDKMVANGLTMYQCKLCTYSTPKTKAMVSHVQGAHVPNAQFPCPYCPCGYNLKTLFMNHMSRRHPGKVLPDHIDKIIAKATASEPEKPKPTPLPLKLSQYETVMKNGSPLYRCNSCLFICRHKGRVIDHMQVSHDPNGKYTCEQCSYRYTHKSAFAMHIARYHSEKVTANAIDSTVEAVKVYGIKLFRCKQCLYTHSIERLVRSHVIKSHDPRGKFPCKKCSCRFAASGSLSSHDAMFHLTHGVGLAPTSTSSRSVLGNLKFEKMRRNGETGVSYRCTSCKFVTQRLDGIKAHMTAAHNPEAALKCPHCTCRYTKQHRLTVHIQTRHPNNGGKSEALSSSKNNSTAEKVSSPKFEAKKKDAELVGYSAVIIRGLRAFKCDYCKYYSSARSDMESHKRVHSLSHKFACHVCSYRYQGQLGLNKHMSIVHGIKSPVKAKLEPIKKINKDWIITMPGYNKIVRNGTVSFKCTSEGCAFTVRSSTQIRYHVLKGHDPDRAFGCNQCPCRFSTEGRLENHVKVYHSHSPKKLNTEGVSGPSMPKKVATEEIQPKEETLMGTSVLKCQISGCAFETKTRYSAVMKMHMKNAHSPTGRFKCELCPCRYNFAMGLTLHMNKVHMTPKVEGDAKESEPPYEREKEERQDNATEQTHGSPNELQCKFCDFTSLKKQHLVTHLMACHALKNQYKCDQCVCRFATDRGLTNHKVQLHSGKKTQKKPVLKTRVSYFNRFKKINSIIHRNTPLPLLSSQHNCTLCDQCFPYESSLQRHVLLAHGPKDPNKTYYECDLCGNSYDTEVGLTVHMTVAHKRKRESDIVVRKELSDEEALDKYFTNATLEAAKGRTRRSVPMDIFKCKQIRCHFSTHRQDLLASHNKEYHAEKPIKCPFCPSIFSSKMDFAFHQSKDHPNSIDTTGVNWFQRKTGVAKVQDNDGDSEDGDHQNDSKIESKLSNQNTKTVFTLKQRRCSKCTFYNSELNVLKHEKVAHVKDGHPCRFCPCTFASLLSMRTHRYQSHIRKRRGFKKSLRNGSDIRPTDKESTASSYGHSSSMSQPARATVRSKSDADATWNCTKCTFSSRSECHLKEHTENAHVENGFKCQYCPCSYRSESSLKRHQTCNHKSSFTKAYQRVLQIKPVSQQSICSSYSKLGSVNGLIKCQKCSFSTRQKINFSTHMKIAHSRRENCTACKVTFNTTMAFNQHMLKFHKRTSFTIPAERIIEAPIAVTGEIPATKETHYAKVNTPNLVQQDAPPEVKTFLEPLFSCSKCSYTSGLRIALNRHEKIHESSSEPTTVTVTKNKSWLDSFDTNSGDEVGPEGKDKDILDEEASNSDHSWKRKISGQSEFEFPKITSVRSVPDANCEEFAVPDANCEEFATNPKPQKIAKIVEDSDAGLSGHRSLFRRSAEKARKFIGSIIEEELRDACDNDINSTHDAHDVLKKQRQSQSKEHKQKLCTDETRKSDAGVETETAESITDKPTLRAVDMIRQRRRSKEALKMERAAFRTPSGPSNNESGQPGNGRTKDGLKEFMRFVCSRCAKSFDSNIQLVAHFQGCERSVKDFKCNICSSRFSTLLKLKEHLWKVHMTENDRKPNEVPQESTPQLQESLPAYTCTLCKIGCKDRKSYILHMSVPHLFRCKRCSFVCGLKSDMETHKHKEHRKKPKNVEVVVVSSEAFNTSQPTNDNDDAESEDILIVYEGPRSKDVAKKDQAMSSPSKQMKTIDKVTTLDSTTEVDQSSCMIVESKNISVPAPLPNPESPVCIDQEDSNVELEPDVEESLICAECGYFSTTVEEAQIHKNAIGSDASLICSVCAYIANTPCDSVLHSKTHDGETSEKQVDCDYLMEAKIETETEVVNTLGDQEFNIVVEFQDDMDVTNEGGQHIEIPIITSNVLTDGSEFVLLDVSQLNPNGGMD